MRAFLMPCENPLIPPIVAFEPFSMCEIVEKY